MPSFTVQDGKHLFLLLLKHSVTGSRHADCRCYPTAGYLVSAAGVTEFPEICAVATQRKGGYEFHIRSNY
jgi:hypothetical protein